LLLFAAASLNAAEFAFEPDVRASGEINDNRRLTSGPHDTVLGALLTIDALAAVRTERTSVEFIPTVRAERYNDDAGIDLDSEDYILSLLIVHNASERSQFEIEAEMALESLLRTEFEDTGILQAGLSRLTTRIAPAWTLLLTEQDTLRLGFSSTLIDNEETGGLVDYSFKTVDTTWTHSFTERDQGSLTLFGSVFSIPDLEAKSKSAGFQIGYTRVFSETFTATASGGIIVSDQDFLSLQPLIPGLPFLVPRPDNSVDSGMLLAASVEKRWGERTTFTGSATRSVSPSGSGFLQSSDVYRVAARHRFLERLTGSFGAEVRQNSSLGEETARQSDRDFFSISARLIYRLAEEWTLSGGYRYRTQSFENSDDEPESNQFLITLAYNAHKRTYQN
jgi:hypothetical protein